MLLRASVRSRRAARLPPRKETMGGGLVNTDELIQPLALQPEFRNVTDMSRLFSTTKAPGFRVAQVWMWSGSRR